MQGVPTISVHQLADALNSPEPPQLLDVREDAEVAASSLPNILHVPLNTLPDNLHLLDPETPVAIICRSGVRSAHATAFLIQEGYTAANVAGGMSAWVEQIDSTQPQP